MDLPSDLVTSIGQPFLGLLLGALRRVGGDALGELCSCKSAPRIPAGYSKRTVTSRFAACVSHVDGC